MRRRGAVKTARRFGARAQRWLHRKRGHLVVKTNIRDYSVIKGEFQFYWRPGYRCMTCKAEWATWK